MGDKGRGRTGALNQIDDRYQGQRDELNAQKALLEFEGKFTGEARAQHEQRLAIVNDFNGKAIAQWESYYGSLTRMEGMWENGALRASTFAPR